MRVCIIEGSMEPTKYYPIQKATNVNILCETSGLVSDFIIFWVTLVDCFAIPKVLGDHPVNSGLIGSDMIIQSIHGGLVDVDSELHMFHLSKHEIINSFSFTVIHPKDFTRTEHWVAKFVPTSTPTSRVVNYPVVGLWQHDVVWSIKRTVWYLEVDLRVADPEIAKFDLSVRLQPESVFVALLPFAPEPGKFIGACQA